MATRLQIRRDTASQWASVNPTLADGEQGWERDTNKIKIGNGLTAWNSLPYTGASAEGTAGGVLSGSYPNPGFAVDMATQAELDAEIAARASAITTEATARANAVSAEATARANADALLIPLSQKGVASGVASLDGSGKVPSAQLPGITGSAGGVLSGTYPNPGFAVDMASQAELDAETTARSNADALLIPLSQKGANSGVATLDSSGKVPTSQMPPLSISDFLGTVGSQSAMLALTGQRGDWAIRTDTAGGSTTWILIGDDASLLGNWKQIAAPGSNAAAISVRGQGALGDVQSLDCSVTASSNVCTIVGSFPVDAYGAGLPALQNTPASFTSADVGKKFYIAGGGAGGAALVGTFTALIDSTHMTMSVTAGTTVATTRPAYPANLPTANFGTDDSAAIQAAIDAAYAQVEAGLTAGGGVLLEHGSYYAKGIVLKTGVYFTGEGLASQLWTAPDSGSTPMVSLGDPQAASLQSCYRVEISNMALYGQRQIACRALDFNINSNSWQNFQGNGPNDPNCNVINIYIQECGGDVAAFFGINLRGLHVDNLRVLNAAFSGVWVSTTDADYYGLSIGGCGVGETGSTPRYALKVDNSNNKFTNSKFWYGLCTVADGVYITSTGRHNQFTNCETQDQPRYGWVLDGTIGCVLNGCVSGGDKLGALMMKAATAFNQIEMAIVGADRWQNTVGLLLDGTGGSPTNNDIVLLSKIADMDATYKQIVVASGATPGTNRIRSNGLQGEMIFYAGGPGAGTYTPDLAFGPIIFIAVVANITIGQVANAATTGQIPTGARVTFIFVQDATGGHTVSWNAAYQSPPAVSTVANSISVREFVNFGTVTAPSWYPVYK